MRGQCRECKSALTATRDDRNVLGRLGLAEYRLGWEFDRGHLICDRCLAVLMDRAFHKLPPNKPAA